jgi:LysR family hydrogen peroxide-inducible transcriptional activator
MDLKQVRYFLVLAQTLNFTRAAEICNLTQPALTKSIQRLEEELGGPLLLRERSLTQLTTLGIEMLPLLEQIQAAAKRANEHATALKNRASSPLRIGFAPDSPTPPFLPLFAELAARLPAFELSVAETGDLVDGLLNGSLDVGVVTDAVALSDRVNRWALFKDLAVLLVPEGHHWVGVDPVSAEMARDMSVVCGVGDRISTVYDRSESPLPPPLHRANTASRAADLVRAGLGVTWSTEMAGATLGLERRRVAWLDPHEVMLVVAAGRPVPKAADAFIKLARARAWE